MQTRETCDIAGACTNTAAFPFRISKIEGGCGGAGLGAAAAAATDGAMCGVIAVEKAR
jgi:hypothetical protein